jgi:probable HAF family extracellular repeat protein
MFFGYPHAINDSGQIAVLGHVVGMEGATAWRYTPGVGPESLGTLGQPGDIEDVPNGINNRGQVVGRSDVGSPPGQVAFLYTDAAGMVSLGSLSTNSGATAYAINDVGQIAGISAGHAFLYTEETGMVAIGEGVGFAINNFGVVAGQGWDETSEEAAIFENGTTRRLGNLGGRTRASAINDHRVVVGAIYYNASYPRTTSGFIWTEEEGMLDLQALVEPGWYFIDIWALNNNGQIAGEAHYFPGGAEGSVAVRLDPIPPKLVIRASATNVVVSWSPAWPGIVLESTETLTERIWQPVATGGTNVVAMPLQGGTRFFRLNLEAIRGLCCAPQ